MAGWPQRINRDSLGPTLQDEEPVVDDRYEIGAGTYNLEWWQSAGMNLQSPRATLKGTVSGSAVTVAYQGIAFDPNGALPTLVITYSSAGIYTFNFPDSQYPDEQGNLVTLSFIGGKAWALAQVGGKNVTGMVVMSGAKSGTIYLQDIDGTSVDADFMIQLW